MFSVLTIRPPKEIQKENPRCQTCFSFPCIIRNWRKLDDCGWLFFSIWKPFSNWRQCSWAGDTGSLEREAEGGGELIVGKKGVREKSDEGSRLPKTPKLKQVILVLTVVWWVLVFTLTASLCHRLLTTNQPPDPPSHVSYLLTVSAYS